MLNNILSTLFTRGLVAILNLLVLLFAARNLGSSLVGEISLIILNISLVQILNEIYTGSALVHFIPKYNLRRVYFGGLLWTIASVILLNTVLYLFHVGQAKHSLQTTALSFLLILHSFHMVILLAREQIKMYNLLLFLQAFTLLSVLYVLVQLSGQKKVESYITALYFAYSIPLLLSSLALSRLLKAEDDIRDYDFKLIVSKGVTNQLGNLAHTLSNRFNYYIIGASAWLGVYANSTSLVESIWLISGSAAPMVLSHMANSGEKDKNSRLVLFIAKICFLLSVLAVIILYFLPNELFVFILGQDFTETKSLMLYLSPGILAISFSTIISHYFSGLGQQRIQLLANSAGLLCTLLLSVYLIGNYGLKGACLTASIAYTVQALILSVVFMRQQNVRFKELLSMKL
ncbi:MAG: polysaccharide biosynthesis C-terminal domain-containing protein [Bacteroidia bacterium]|nr:polysaccharide biosynthesis C-terminal domain-containing protein [Bacteroidia bacterium]